MTHGFAKKSTTDHGSLGGLLDDNHTQYVLNTGRSGGQTIIGGIVSGDDITFQSNTSNDGVLRFVDPIKCEDYIDFDEISTPANPSADDGRLYVKDDGGTTTLYFRDSAGTETDLLAGGGGGGTPGGTSGAVQYNDASSFAGDSANFFWDKTNKRLGIGTNSPTFELDVRGDLIIVSESVSTIRGLQASQHDNVSGGALYLATKSRGTFASPTAVSDGDFGGFFGCRWHDGSSYRRSGGFGFVIDGTVSTNVIPTRMGIYTSASSNNGPAGYGIEGITILPNSNVGIGNLNPTVKFDVSGKGRFEDELVCVSDVSSTVRGVQTNQHSNDPGGAVFIGAKSRGTFASPTAVSDGDFGGFFGCIWHDGNSYRRSGGFGFVIDGAVSTNVVPTRMGIYTSASSNNGASGYGLEGITLLPSGNVGVNNTNPSEQFDVTGLSRAQTFTADGDPGSGSASTTRYTGVTDTPTTNPGWATSSTVNMNAPDGYMKMYVGTQAVVVPYWNT